MNILLRSNEEELMDVVFGDDLTAEGAVFKIVPHQLSLTPGQHSVVK
jgi:hypothetical protein